ncbi:hypothetical protein GGR52DRAFT_46943 [Hypoxylon sp. FL1284]|nr:hypothetical protein GGR52DRAFT_46943 [Hypoxylon sp. FL1284]
MTDTPITAATAPLPPSELREPSPPAPLLPPVTTGGSARHVAGLVDAVTRASPGDPLNAVFQAEKLSRDPADVDAPTLRRMAREMAAARIAAKLATGAFVAEAAGFAAVACWGPARAPATDEDDADEVARAAAGGRPVFAGFLGKCAALRRVHLYPVARRVSGGRYWKLNLMARDPEVPYVPGAVRALLVPFMERFTSDQNEGGPMPVWLEAGSEQARAVYAHYGFRDVGEMDIRGIKTWGMIYTGNIDVEKGDSRST